MKLMISYARLVNDKFIYELADRLHNSPSYQVWIDRNQLTGGVDWWNEICQAIETADCVIVVLTQRSLDSIYCTTELDYALELNKPILPLKLENIAIPAKIKNRQIEDIILTSLEQTLKLCFQSLVPILQDKHRGMYNEPVPHPKRPLVPSPAKPPSKRPSDLFASAVEAQAVGNFGEARRLLDQVKEADPHGSYGQEAVKLALELEREEKRAIEYMDVVRAAMGSNEASRRGAEALWRAFKARYGAAFDPQGLEKKLLSSDVEVETMPTPPPPLMLLSDPPSNTSLLPETTWADYQFTSSLDTRVGLARHFLFSGTHNRDWKPYFETFDEVEMCLIPTGRFRMGLDSEAYYYDPQHSKWMIGVPDGGQHRLFQPFAPFWIDRYPVTNQEYRRAVQAGACEPPKDRTFYDDPRFDNHPVVHVTWHMATKYAEWRSSLSQEANYRLPSEREWEYAARGIENFIYPWGNEFIPENAVWGRNSGNTTAEVTSRAQGASWVGALHMCGNVWEWCSSEYQNYPYRDRPMMKHKQLLRVLRGGSWRMSAVANLRMACRFSDVSSTHDSVRGFRLVRPQF